MMVGDAGGGLGCSWVLNGEQRNAAFRGETCRDLRV